MDEQAIEPRSKAKSSHDMLNDPKLSKKAAVEVKQTQEEVVPQVDERATSFQSKMREKVRAKMAHLQKDEQETPTETQEELPQEENQQPTDKKDEKPKKLAFKTAKTSKDDKTNVGKDYLNEQRQKYTNKRKAGNRDDEALKRVQMFSNRMLSAESGQDQKKRKVSADVDEDQGWQTHLLKFDKSHTAETKKAEEDYELYDPLTHSVDKKKSKKDKK
jgi:peptidyl-prolyl cis-trans isomerase SDCCAG10